MSAYQEHPVIPFKINPDDSMAEDLEKLGDCSFHGRNFAQALDIREAGLDEGHQVVFGLSRAPSPAGMRSALKGLTEKKYKDCLVSTGAGISPTSYETRRYHHRHCHLPGNDKELKIPGSDRIYNTLVDDSLL